MGEGDQDSGPSSLPDMAELVDARWDDDDISSGVTKTTPEKPLAPKARPSPSEDLEFVPQQLGGAADKPRPRLPSLELPFSLPGEDTFDHDEAETAPTASAPSLELGLENPPSDPALDLGPIPTSGTSPTEPEDANDPELTAMRDRYATGDFTGALVAAEGILESQPKHEEARRYADSCENVLIQMYAARLGPLDSQVEVTIPPDEIRWLSLDHRAGFLLSMVDGNSSIEEILDVSGMPRLDALRILYTLLEQETIRLRNRS